MKKSAGTKRKSPMEKIEDSTSVEELLDIAGRASGSRPKVAVSAYRKAISVAQTGGDFARIIEELSYLPDPDSEDYCDELPYDYKFLCNEAALAGARKFAPQRKWNENAEDGDKWDSSDLKRIIDAVDEFLGNYLLVEKILNPDAKNEDYDWSEPGKQN